MRTIQVEGEGRIKQSPDTIEITMSLETEDKDYVKTMNEANEKVEILRQDLSSVGFERDSLKTTNFSVDSRFDNVRNEKGENERVFRGYHSSHNLILRFDFSSERLAQVISALSSSDSKAEFSIRFTIKDQNAYINTILLNAVLDATAKARVLAEASQVALGEIQSVVFGSPSVAPYSPTQFRPRMFADSANASAIHISPEDIESSEKVSMIWEIL